MYGNTPRGPAGRYPVGPSHAQPGDCLWTCTHSYVLIKNMDAVDEALARSREDRLAESLAAFKTKYARRQRDRAVRQARRRAGLRLRHAAKLARIPDQRMSD